jgi:hypothetical protein
MEGFKMPVEQTEEQAPRLEDLSLEQLQERLQILKNLKNTSAFKIENKK